MIELSTINMGKYQSCFHKEKDVYHAASFYWNVFWDYLKDIFFPHCYSVRWESFALYIYAYICKLFMGVHNLNSHPLNSLDQSKDPWGLWQNVSFQKGHSHFMYFVQVAPDLAMWVYISLFLLTIGIDLVTYLYKLCITKSNICVWVLKVSAKDQTKQNKICRLQSNIFHL